MFRSNIIVTSFPRSPPPYSQQGGDGAKQTQVCFAPSVPSQGQRRHILKEIKVAFVSFPYNCHAASPHYCQQGSDCSKQTISTFPRQMQQRDIFKQTPPLPYCQQGGDGTNQIRGSFLPSTPSQDKCNNDIFSSQPKSYFFRSNIIFKSVLPLTASRVMTEQNKP